MKTFRAILLTGLAFGLSANMAVAGEPAVRIVQVKEAQVRQTPNFLGKILATLSNGEYVDTLGAQGAWVQVTVGKPTKTGWMHESALNPKAVKLASNGAKAGLSSDEDDSPVLSGKGFSKDVTLPGDDIALAGKGFKDLEQEYLQAHATANIDAVNTMEQVVISQEQMAKFVKEGALQPEGGADK